MYTFSVSDIVHRDLKLENILLSQNPNDPTDKLHIKVGIFQHTSSNRFDHVFLSVIKVYINCYVDANV